ncbi:MAG: metal-dependent transcriptional regulator [Eubacteriales bacterium]
MHESGENYLETILILKQAHSKVRSIDIAKKLNYAKPSISRAVSILKKNKLITVNGDGSIDFTPEGEKKANEIYDRHCQIAEFLMKTLGLDSDTAHADSCRIEHIISQETFSKIKKYLNEHK